MHYFYLFFQSSRDSFLKKKKKNIHLLIFPFLPLLGEFSFGATHACCDHFVVTSQGAWNPIFSTAPTVLNNLLLFTSSTSERCNSWLLISINDLFLVNLWWLFIIILLLLVRGTCDPTMSLYWLKLLKSSPEETFLPLLWLFVMGSLSFLKDGTLYSWWWSSRE